MHSRALGDTEACFLCNRQDLRPTRHSPCRKYVPPPPSLPPFSRVTSADLDLTLYRTFPCHPVPLPSRYGRESRPWLPKGTSWPPASSWRGSSGALLCVGGCASDDISSRGLLIAAVSFVCKNSQKMWLLRFQSQTYTPAYLGLVRQSMKTQKLALSRSLPTC